MSGPRVVSLDGLLPADVGINSGSGVDAPDRRTASGLSVCRRHDAARSASAGRPCDWAAARGHPDEAHGHHGVYRKPYTSQRYPAHKVYPYLLRNLEITRSNHVWAADIIYIPMKRGFVYLLSVLDWSSRRVLAWRLSNTLTTDFCREAV